MRTGFDVDDPQDGSYLSVCFAVERELTAGSVTAGDEPDAARFWQPERLLASDDAETRSVTEERLEAAFERLRGESPGWRSE